MGNASAALSLAVMTVVIYRSCSYSFIIFRVPAVSNIGINRAKEHPPATVTLPLSVAGVLALHAVLIDFGVRSGDMRWQGHSRCTPAD